MTKEEYLSLPDKDKLELLENVINSIRLQDKDNPTKEINMLYLIDLILENYNLEDL